jgi:hypothetical protein
VIVGLQLLVVANYGLSLTGRVLIDPLQHLLVRNPLFYNWLGWVLEGLILLAIIGLLFLKRWGWVLTMIITGVGLLYSIWQYFQGDANYVALALYIVIVFYLNQGEVQASFLRTSSQGDF